MNKAKTQADNAADIEIANRILEAMQLRGMHLTDLEAATGISYSSLRRSLHQNRPDRRSLSIKQFDKVAEALNIRRSLLLPNYFVAQDAA